VPPLAGAAGGQVDTSCGGMASGVGWGWCDVLLPPSILSHLRRGLLPFPGHAIVPPGIDGWHGRL
jgi:hypothetical protein